MTFTPFDSEVRTFDAVFSQLEVEKYLIIDKDSRGRIDYNSVQMLKLILFCQMEKIQSLRQMEKADKTILESCGLRIIINQAINQSRVLWIDI